MTELSAKGLRSPLDILGERGRILQRFDERTQDSGNHSFLVETPEGLIFAKTAGPEEGAGSLPYRDRCDLLKNAAALYQSVNVPALPGYLGLEETLWGPMLILEGRAGDLLWAPEEQRSSPDSAFFRLRCLPVPEILGLLTTLYEAHRELEAQGWIASDLYDGSLLYDFESRRLSLVDLDHYQRGPFQVAGDRCFGSSRFMAPEEFKKGAWIDARTTVYQLGRFALAFLCGPGGARVAGAQARFRASKAHFDVVQKACGKVPEHRYNSVSEFYEAWCRAT